MLMRPNKADTAVHGCHCPGYMTVSVRKVLARPSVGVRVCHLLFIVVFTAKAELSCEIYKFNFKETASGKVKSISVITVDTVGRELWLAILSSLLSLEMDCNTCIAGKARLYVFLTDFKSDILMFHS